MNSDEISELKRELAAFRLAVNQRLDKMEARLNARAEGSEKTAKISDSSHRHDSVKPSTSVTPEPKSASQPGRTKSTKKAFVGPPVPLKPSWLKSFLWHLVAIIFGWFEPIVTIYRTYKKRGMGHVFLLTLGGIGLTLVGVGYLMQLMIEQMEVGVRSLLFCAVSGAVIAGGFRLHKSSLFKDYAVALVAMGILIGYTTVYFSGNVYLVLSSGLTLGAYCLIAIGCHLIARKLDANIIYSLGIIGVALLPMLAAKGAHGSLWYLLSVCFVAGSSLWYAYKQQIVWLTGLTMVGTSRLPSG